MKSWKTTLFGILAAMATGVATGGPPQAQGWAALAATVFGSLFAMFAKDANVTGGTVSQNPPK
jgi:hypothetical protein